MNRFEKLSHQQRVLLFAFVVVVFCILLVLFTEGVVRARHWVKYGGMWGIEETYTTDPVSGLRVPVAGKRIGNIEINSLGFRGPEIEIPKPKSTIRVAFLGGSTTYSAEVSGNEKTWPHLVWKGLSSQWPYATFDYINAGVPGYGTANSLRRLKYNVASLKPDIVIIYHAINDLSYNSFKLAEKEGVVRQRTEQTLSWPSEYSLLWYLLEKNLKIIMRKAQSQGDDKKWRVNQESVREPFKAGMEDLVKASQEIADIVAVVTFSYRVRRDQSEETRAEAASTNLYYMPYMSVDSILDSFESYNQAIRQVAENTGAILVGEELTIPGDSMHFADSVHFTDKGSSVMAKRVISALSHSNAFKSLVSSRKQ